MPYPPSKQASAKNGVSDGFRAAVALTLAGVAGAALLCATALCANRDALRQIVQEQCAVHWQQQHDPAPCERVEAAFALLADRKGGAHFLLIPRSPLMIGGADYEALRIMGADLDGANPFALLAARMPQAQARNAMGDYTLVLAGMQFESGPGFVLLAGTSRAGELLLDSTSAVAAA